MKEALIQYIHVNDLYPHPQNPRKDLGDLTELAASIREQGILQNLTVINNGMGIETCEYSYTIIIGHRRHAAAKLAGFERLPCIVTDMSLQEQLETMLLENVQRSDLTVAEEAAGFHQLRFDMGVSVADIARKTGYSEGKVRQRLKIAELPADAVQQRVVQGATLQDIIAVSEFEDEKTRDKLLESAGSGNFGWALQRAKDALRADAQRKKLLARLAELGAEEIKLSKGKAMWMPEYSKYRQAKYIGLPGEEEPDLLQGAPEGYSGKLFYRKQDKNTFIIYYLHPDAEKMDAAARESTAKTEETAQRRERLKALKKKMQEKRMSFIRAQKCDKMNEGRSTVLLQEALLKGGAVDLELLGRVLDLNDDENGDFYEVPDTLDAINEMIEDCGGTKIARPKLSLLLWYCMMDSDTGVDYANWHDDYRRDPDADALYDLLINRLGYEMTEEEAAWRDGSHKVYAKDGEA